jgi:molecular chaperone GrpE
LDNLNRAIDFAAESKEEKTTEFQHFFDGIVLVNQQLNEIFAGMGVVPITSIGERFDPHFHEAVATDDSSDFPQNTVTAELLRGYRLGNRVIRHSMVKVAAASRVSEVE